LREHIGALLDEVSQFVDDAATLGSGHRRPRTFIECLSCGDYSAVYILLLSFRNLCQHLASGRVNCLERLAGRSTNPFPINEQFFGAVGEEGSNLGMQFASYVHMSILSSSRVKVTLASMKLRAFYVMIALIVNFSS